MSSYEWASMRRLSELLECSLAELGELARRAPGLYESFDIAIPGRKVRHIDNPIGELRSAQKRLAKIVLRNIQMPSFVFGSVPGRAAVDMAKLHENKACVVAMDIRTCFPSVKPRLVLHALMNHGGFGRDTASVTTKLTTRHGGLPQGAPTSSFLLNLVLLDMHASLAREARAMGLDYSVFVDDIVISGRRPEVMLDKVANSLSRLGLSASRSKTKVMRRDQQEVLGVRLNPKRDVKPELYAKLWAEVEEAKRCGFMLESARKRVSGILAYMSSVNQDVAAETRSLVDALLSGVEPVSGDMATVEAEYRVPCKHRRRHRRHRCLETSQTGECSPNGAHA